MNLPVCKGKRVLVRYDFIYPTIDMSSGISECAYDEVEGHGDRPQKCRMHVTIADFTMKPYSSGFRYTEGARDGWLLLGGGITAVTPCTIACRGSLMTCQHSSASLVAEASCELHWAVHSARRAQRTRTRHVVIQLQGRQLRCRCGYYCDFVEAFRYCSP